MILLRKEKANLTAWFKKFSLKKLHFLKASQKAKY